MKNDDIKKILEQIQAPEPSESARKLALAKALAEFDKKNKNTTQGISKPSRLIDIFNQLDRRINMKKAYYYGASISTIAILCGVLTYGEFNSLNQVSDKEDNKQVIISQHQSIPAPELIPNAIVIPEPKKPEPKKAAKKEELDSLSGRLRDLSARNDEAVAVGADSPPAPAPAAIMATPAAPAAVDALAKKSYISDGRVRGDFRMLSGAKPVNVGSFMPAPGVPNQYSEQWQQQQYVGNDKFEATKTNPVKVVAEEPVSTFSIDVDTSSYSFLRRQLNMGVLPQKDAVRVEEMVNYFDYNYALPDNRSQPFKANVNVFPSPWHKGNKLVHIGIKGFDIAKNERQKSNLVFLIDTSGSMQTPDRLPLLISSLGMLVNTLDDDDTVSIVTYAGYAGTALEPTKVKDKAKILSVLQSLQSGGSTAGAAGIQQAYTLAEQNFDKNGVNRVILGTDGDFNVGISDPNELQNYIEKKRDTGIFLSVLGFGQGNYNDALMQKLAQNGNGNAAYIDNINEARKVLVQEANSTIFPIAKDVKIQVEFNKDKVSEYRLIGYETRLLQREDFNNDKVDAGEIGAGHAVTAIYEITPKGEKGLVDEPRYNKGEQDKSVDTSNEYGFIKIRYKLPKESTSKLITTPITTANESVSIEQAPQDARFAAAVVAFGEMLHGDSYLGDFKYDDIEKLAEGAKGEDKFGYRAEFLNLVKLAHALPVVKQDGTIPPPPAPPVTY